MPRPLGHRQEPGCNLKYEEGQGSALDPLGPEAPDPINWLGDEEAGARTVARRVRPPPYHLTK